MQCVTAEIPGQKPERAANSFVKNSAANVARMAVTSLVAILLPAYLVHHLSVQIYGAWVLILNLGAYVGYLDFGVQTAVAKYISEYEAVGDVEGCNRCVGIGLLILLIASVLGVLLTIALAWYVPELFRNMPATLYRDVRISVLFVGISLAISLPSSVFSTIFVGLQRYQIPMITTVAGRLLYAAALCGAVFFRGDLITMGIAVAAANVLGALLQIVAWKKLAQHIRVRVLPIDSVMFRRMTNYCFVLTIWSACMLFITGLDVTIVGHFAFRQVAFYSIATAPTNFVLMVIGALLGPLLPATSALSTERTARDMGRLLLRSTRYATTALLLTGLPLMLGGYLVLRLWVGQTFATNSVQLLRVLLVANIIRQLCAPYATMIVATARQGIATAAAMTEGVVNLAASIFLARHYGAMGVAGGTLIGALSSVAMHFFVSMHYSRNLAVTRAQLFLRGILRPFAMAIPTTLLLPLWWLKSAPRVDFAVCAFWGMSSLLLMWYVSLTSEDRDIVRMKLHKVGELT